MRLRSCVVGVVLATAVLPGGVRAADDAPYVTATAAIVMERTGEILWSRSPDLELPPASTTKVMTAILALESDALERTFPASSEACRVVPRKVNLRPGQRLRLEDLVYAILLNSANDASVVIAESLAGSVPAFGDRMTARARQLGALHTRFLNPHGLTEEGHYTTARDLVTIFDHALDVPRFREIISTKAITVPVENSGRGIALHSHNRLLTSYRIPVIGKTGYTIPAKKCFVGDGMYDGREILVAVLGSTDLWGDVKRLLEFGYGDSMPPAAPALQRAKMRPTGKRSARRQWAAGSPRGAVAASTRTKSTRQYAARSPSATAASARGDATARPSRAASTPRPKKSRKRVATTGTGSTSSASSQTGNTGKARRSSASSKRRTQPPPKSE